MNSTPGSTKGRLWLRSAASAFALMVSLSALPLRAARNPQDAPDTQPDAQNEPAETVQQAPNQQPPDQTVEQPAPSAAPGGEQDSYQPLPATLDVPAGTVISVRVSQFLSSDHNVVGDSFSAELQKPLVVDGWVVARRGQTVVGRVAVAQKAGRVKGVSQLGVELAQLVLVDGKQMPVRTQLQQSSGGTSNGRDAAAIGTTTGLGAAIGAGAHGGEGAGIGAAAGAAAGIAGVLLTRGRPTVIPPESVLTFQLQSPLSVSTQRSRPAFRPVTQEDYDGGKLQRRPQRIAGPGYPPPPPYYWGYYPGPFFFGFSGFGHGFGGRDFRR